MNKKLFANYTASGSIFSILSKIRESFYAFILSANNVAQPLSEIDQFIHLYIPCGHSAIHGTRLQEIEASPLYKSLGIKYSPGLLLAMTHTVFYLEQLINVAIVKSIPLERTNPTNFQEKYKIHLEQEPILNFIQRILETKIKNSFYHPGPISIFDLEILQLMLRIKNTINKDLIKKRALSPEVCGYIIVNCFIKYFLPPTNPYESDIRDYYM